MSYVPSLSDLFAGADAIGRKYQTAQEIEAHEQELYDIRKDIDEMTTPKNAGKPFIGNTSQWGEINPKSRFGKLMASAGKFDGDTEDYSRDVDAYSERVDLLEKRMAETKAKYA